MVSWTSVVLGVYCSFLLNWSHSCSKLLILISEPILVRSLMACFLANLLLDSVVFSVS